MIIREDVDFIEQLELKFKLVTFRENFNMSSNDKCCLFAGEKTIYFAQMHLFTVPCTCTYDMHTDNAIF